MNQIKGYFCSDETMGELHVGIKGCNLVEGIE